MTTQRNDELNEAIQRSQGGGATIWEYAASLSQLTIRVTWPDSAENLHFVCNACTRIEASTAWDLVDFEVLSLANGRITLIDRRAKFLLHCGLVRVFRNVEPIFGSAVSQANEPESN